MGADLIVQTLSWKRSKGQSVEKGFNKVCDALDSLLLAHYCAGIDISSEAYQEGVSTTLDAICNHLAGEGV